MLTFKTKDELQNCEELQNMGRYEWQEVILKGERVIACTTDQQYEDILWSGVYEVLEELCEYYGKDIDVTDLTSQTRDFVLKSLEKDYGIKFVNVFDEY